MKNNSVRSALLKKRTAGECGYIPFINAGDPDLETTKKLILLCQKQNACAIELGVPFAHSITDGPTILNSHERALQRNIVLEDVLGMIGEIRELLHIPVALLLEYNQTVKGKRLDNVLYKCVHAGCDAVLMHCLPPLLVEQYIRTASDYGIEIILGLFPNSQESKIDFVINRVTGYIYMASTFGKTGSGKVLNKDTLAFFNLIRRKTDLPLAAGFGIATAADLEAIHSHGIDAGIIGSPLVRIIEKNLHDKEQMLHQFENYLIRLQEKKDDYGK